MKTFLRRLAALTALGLVVVLATGPAAGAYGGTFDPIPTPGETVTFRTTFFRACWPGDPSAPTKDIHILDTTGAEVVLLEDVAVEVQPDPSGDPQFDGWKLEATFTLPATSAPGFWTWVVTETDAPVLPAVVLTQRPGQPPCPLTGEGIFSEFGVVEGEAIPLVPVPVLGGVGALAALVGGMVLVRRRPRAVHAG